jgi:hypothetical protein
VCVDDLVFGSASTSRSVHIRRVAMTQLLGLILKMPEFAVV